MEYVQELDKIKTEVENSGKKIEDLSKLMQNLSGLTKLQDSINNFQEDNVLNRIETKIDILAQTDYSELFNFSINSLKDELAKKNEEGSSVSEFDNFNEKLNDLSGTLDLIKTDLESVANNPDTELIKSKINYISEKLNNYNESVENKLNDKDALLEDLSFLKDNFYKINEKFSEITHLIRTNTAESEELNNRFESNITNFNSGFQNIYERFNNLDNTFNSSFADFKTCIQDIYDQFSTIDSRSDLDQLKFYVQSFNNKMLSIAEILETLKENNFSIKVDNQEEIQELHEAKNKIELLNNNICNFLEKFDNNTFIENEKSETVNNKLNSILDETQNFSNRISNEFSSLTSPLVSAIEITNSLKDSIDELLAKDDVRLKKEALQLLNKFEEVYKSAENNFESLFNASKHFYEKIEEVKNEFNDISYDTNSKINDFLSKADVIDLKIQNNLSSSESALNSLKNISGFAENQINLTSESLNMLKTGMAELSENFNYFKNDITDISSKINKVILSEKDNSILLNNSFNDLKEEINKNFEANTENLSDTGEKIVKKLSDELKVINKKLDKTEEISSGTLEKTEDVKDALVYMAEWFDTAGKLIEENNHNLKRNSVEKVDIFIKKTEENITEQLKRISDKLNRFEIRMESIEGKIEKLEDKHSNREVMTLLADILEKVELANERSKSNEFMISRLESLETKIKELDDKKPQKSSKKSVKELI